MAREQAILVAGLLAASTRVGMCSRAVGAWSTWACPRRFRPEEKEDLPGVALGCAPPDCAPGAARPWLARQGGSSGRRQACRCV